MTKPRTKHFALHEWEGHGPCPRKYWRNVQRLMEALEVIRAELGGKSIAITQGGGYRSPSVNKQNKGRATRSQHLFGKAADIRVPGVAASKVYYTIQRLQQEGKIPHGGLAAYIKSKPAASYVHYDIRGRNARWRAAP